jgi:hypothetical protein
MFLEVRHPTCESHAVGVYIDNNLGMMANDIMFADSIDQVAEIMRQSPSDDGELRLEQIDPAVAGAEIRAAMELTEMTLDPLVSDEYAGLRALAMLRADEAPGGAVPSDRDDRPAEERDALRDAFLASPEGRAFARDGDEAFVVSLAIDFVQTTLMEGRCGGVRSWSSCSWPIGCRARCSPTPRSLRCSRRRLMRGCGSPVVSEALRHGRSPSRRRP